MTKREITILAIAVVVCIGGVVHFLYADSSPRKQALAYTHAKNAQVRALIVKTADQINHDSLTAAEKLILKKASARWSKDPFVQQQLTPFTKSKKPGASSVEFSYTGFVKAGRKRLAIINGLEYGVGDMLADAPVVVKKITQQTVTLEEKTKGRIFSVPYVDQIF